MLIDQYGCIYFVLMTHKRHNISIKEMLCLLYKYGIIKQTSLEIICPEQKVNADYLYV